MQAINSRMYRISLFLTALLYCSCTVFGAEYDMAEWSVQQVGMSWTYSNVTESVTTGTDLPQPYSNTIRTEDFVKIDSQETRDGKTYDLTLRYTNNSLVMKQWTRWDTLGLEVTYEVMNPEGEQATHTYTPGSLTSPRTLRDGEPATVNASYTYASADGGTMQVQRTAAWTPVGTESYTFNGQSYTALKVTVSQTITTTTNGVTGNPTTYVMTIYFVKTLGMVKSEMISTTNTQVSESSYVQTVVTNTMTLTAFGGDAPQPTTETRELVLSANSGSAPLAVTFEARGASGLATYVWDFDGDGTSDKVGFEKQAQFTYRQSGTYSMSVAVWETNDNFTLTATITVETTAGAPTVTLSASPASGDAPLATTFTASVTDDGTITKYLWDFNGDSITDRITTTATTTYTYTLPSVWTPEVTAEDNTGLQAAASASVTVSLPSTPAGIFEKPDNNAQVAGAYVSVGVATTPNVSAVVVEVQKQGTGTWTAIGTMANRGLAWRGIWDTTTMADGTYDLRARLTGLDGQTSEVTGRSVSVVNAQVFGSEQPQSDALVLTELPTSLETFGVEMLEALDTLGARVFLQTVDPNTTNTLALQDIAEVTLPAGAVQTETTMRLRQLVGEALQARSTARQRTRTGSGTTGVELSTSSNGASFALPVSVVLSYPDADNDGIEDNLQVSETRLAVFRENSSGGWDEIPATQDASSNTFTVQTMDTGDFIVAEASDLQASASLSTSQTTYTTGEMMDLKLTLSASGAVDIYMAIFLPDGSWYAVTFGPQFYPPEQITPFASDWSGSISSTSVVAFPLPTLAEGTYSWYVVVIPKGGNIYDSSSWLTTANATWTFTN